MFKWLFIKFFLYNSIAHELIIKPEISNYLSTNNNWFYIDRSFEKFSSFSKNILLKKSMNLLFFSSMAERKQNLWKIKFKNKIYAFHKKLFIYTSLLLGFNLSLIVFFPYFLLFFLKNFFPYLQLALKDKLEKDPKYKDYQTLLKGILQSLEDNNTLLNINTGSFLHRFMLNFCQFIVFNLRDLVQVADTAFEYTKALPVLQVITKFFQVANTTFSAGVMFTISFINFILIYLILKNNNVLNLMETKYLKNKINTISNPNPLEKKYLKDNNLFLKTLIFKYKKNMPSKIFIMIFSVGFLTIFYINFIFLNNKSQTIVEIYKKLIHDKVIEKNDDLFWDPLFLIVMTIFILGFNISIYIYNHRFIESMNMD